LADLPQVENIGNGLRTPHDEEKDNGYGESSTDKGGDNSMYLANDDSDKHEYEDGKGSNLAQF
jgi:hypothetical protein